MPFLRVTTHGVLSVPVVGTCVILFTPGPLRWKLWSAERYVRGRNTLASPYRYQLDVDPDVWFLEDDGYELAVFHSHISAPARPSRTDVENIGLWEGRPYLILSLGTGELAAFTIEGGRISELELG